MSEALCPRCGTFRPSDAAICANCGIPFTQANYNGIPNAVAEQGVPAGFWIRFAASFIDFVILVVISVVPVLIWLFSGDNLPEEGETVDLPAWTDWIFYVVLFVYSIVFIAHWGATPGKRLLNVYVLDAKGRQHVGYVRAIVRALASIPSFLLLLIGYIMVAFRQDKRGLHDLIAGTYPTQKVRRWR
jgi:uncharacterized RDD family membrane protein YckC